MEIDVVTKKESSSSAQGHFLAGSDTRTIVLRTGLAIGSAVNVSGKR